MIALRPQFMLCAERFFVGARQAAHQRRAVRKLVPPSRHNQIFPVPGHRDIGQLGVHALRGQYIRAIDRHPLTLVDRERVAVIEMAILRRVDRESPVVVEAHMQHGAARFPVSRCIDPFDGGQCSVLHLHHVLVLQEHDALAGGDRNLPVFGSHGLFGTQLAGGPPQFAHARIQRVALFVGMRQQQLGFAGAGMAIILPLRDQLLPRIGDSRIQLHTTVFRIRGHGRLHIVPGQRQSCFALPRLVLPLDLGQAFEAVCCGRFARHCAESIAGVCSEAGRALEKMGQAGKNFEIKYENRFKTPIQIYAPFTYDAVYIIVDAMKRANSIDPAKILAAMPSTDYTGIIGETQFDRHGDLKHGVISLYDYKAGKKTLLNEIHM
ncbi:substrate-binding protein [Burkholderia sp. OK233]|nr:substrate-binding protein [Burkholderia sp. OK233]